MLQSHKVAQESALVLATDIIFHNRLWKFLSFLFNSKPVSMVKIVCSTGRSEPSKGLGEKVEDGVQRWQMQNHASWEEKPEK